jgi:elongation factor Ts
MVKELRESTGAGMLDCKKALEATNGNMDEAVTWLREKGISKAAKKADRIAAEGLVNIIVEGNKASIIELNSETDFVASNAEFTGLLDTISKLVVSNDVDTVEDALNLPTEEGTLNDTIVAKIAKIGEKLSFRRFKSATISGNEVFGVYIHNTKKIATLIVLEGGDETVAKNIAMHASAMRPKYVRRDEISTEDLNKEREVQKQIAINEGKPADIAEKMVEGRINKFYKEVCLEEQEYIIEPDISVGQYAKNNGATIKSMIRYEVGEGMEKRSDNFAEEVMSQVNKQ